MMIWSQHQAQLIKAEYDARMANAHDTANNIRNNYQQLAVAKEAAKEAQDPTKNATQRLNAINGALTAIHNMTGTEAEGPEAKALKEQMGELLKAPINPTPAAAATTTQPKVDDGTQEALSQP